jgi:hypothetical protein
MLFNPLNEFRSAGIPASIKEHLILLEAFAPMIAQESKIFDFSRHLCV